MLGFNVEERPHSSVRHEVEFGRVVGRVLGRMYHMYRIYRKGTIAPSYSSMADLDGHVTTPMLIRSRQGCPTAIKYINSFDKLTRIMNASFEVMSMMEKDESAVNSLLVHRFGPIEELAGRATRTSFYPSLTRRKPHDYP